MKKILDVGCSHHKIPGTVRLDIDPTVHPDILHDLNIFPYPIEDNMFDQIYAKHIIEHLNDPIRFMREMCRILKRGGVIFVETPHFSSRIAYSDPTHQNYFSYLMLTNILRGLELEIEKQRITFYKTFRTTGIAFLANRFPDNYERFWTYIFPAENLTLLAKKR